MSHSPTNDPHFQINERLLAFLVGSVAIALPVIMIIASMTPYAEWRDSISHYYYAAFLGDVFIVMLAFIGTFMTIYRGQNRWESILAFFAGIATFCIAIFPTSQSGLEDTKTGDSADALARIFIDIKSVKDMPDPGDLIIRIPQTVLEGECMLGSAFCLFPKADWIHYGSAAIVFSFLTWYCLVVFAKEVPKKHNDKGGKIAWQKIWRNRIYRACGIVMILCMLALVLRSTIGGNWAWWQVINGTFWAEAFALIAFGLGWLVRSRFLGYALVDPKDSEGA